MRCLRQDPGVRGYPEAACSEQTPRLGAPRPLGFVVQVVPGKLASTGQAPRKASI